MKSKLLLLVLCLGIHASAFSDDKEAMVKFIVINTAATALGNTIYGLKKGTLLSRTMVPSVVSYMGSVLFTVAVGFQKRAEGLGYTKRTEINMYEKYAANTLLAATILSAAGTAYNMGQIINSALD